MVRGPCNISCGMCPAALSQLVDAPSNTYSGLRIQNATHNVMYAEFRPQDSPADHASTNSTEFYDIAADPYQLTNLALTAPPELLAAYSRELFLLANCTGAECP